jgi:hypothetical protein
VAGTIRQGGAYYIYANVTDSGNPASGVASVKANASPITANQTNANLVAGSYTVGGATYTHRSGSLTAKNPLPAGSATYTLTATDAASNSKTETGFSVAVENTAPAAVDVQAANGVGGTAGKAELGDTITFSFSEPIDPDSILDGWSGASTAAVVRIANGGSGDTLTVRNADSSAQLPLGSVNLVRTEFVTGTVNFGASGTAGQMTMSGNSVTLVLGTPSGGTTGTAAAAAALVWTPAAGATDWSGNAMPTTALTEGGAADVDF